MNCTPPAVARFPPDVFTEGQRQSGVVLLHVAVLLYAFAALALVCRDYLVAALGHICQRLGFGEAVAGATFMAIGGSAPELLTALIGVFVARGDVGTGTVIGSAAFNTLVIVGVCALTAGQALQLSWWPLLRDLSFYTLSIVALLFVLADGSVSWVESLVLLLLYAVYILLMKFDQSAERWVSSQVDRYGFTGFLKPAGADARADYDRFDNSEEYPFFASNQAHVEIGYYQDYGISMAPKKTQPTIAASSINAIQSAVNVANGMLQFRHRRKTLFEFVLYLLAINRRCSARTRIIALTKLLIIERRRQCASGAMSRPSTQRAFSRELLAVDPDLPSFDDWMIRPNRETVGGLAWARWHVVAPIRFALYYTIPDCRKTAEQRYFMATFGVSVVWVGALAYVMVWMAAIVGTTLGVPESVMGVAVLAVGTSVPDLITSLIVAKRGQTDMAVSNCLGSNVVNLLVCLGLPWFLRTAIFSSGSPVAVISGGLVYSTALLLLTVAVLLAAVYWSKWSLKPYTGLVFLVAYAVFVTFASMIESNAFGNLNPPICQLA